MGEVHRYCIDGFELTVYESCYLVEVEKTGSGPIPKGPLLLPEWVFGSKNAIWLAVEKAPIDIRARDGEELKQRLHRRLVPRKK